MLRALAALSCRFLALSTAIGLIQSGSALLTLFASTFGLFPGAGAPSLPLVLLQLVPIAGLILLALILWTQADAISAYMVRESADDAAPALSVERLQALAFSVMGLYVLTGVLPRLAQAVANLLMVDSSAPNPNADVFTGVSSGYAIGWVSMAVEIALGVWLLFGARGLVYLLANIRHIGRDREARQEIESPQVPTRPEN